MKRFLQLNLILFYLLSIPSAFAVLEPSNEPVKIGILAFRPKAETLARWKPLENYINSQTPTRHFQIEAYTYSDLGDAVATRQIDFVFANPSYYIHLKEQYNLSYPLASLIKKTGEHTLSAFAGVIFTLASRSDINQLKDLKNLRIATAKTASLGGYQMQSYALYQEGLPTPNPEQLLITGMPHDNVIDAVLSDRADIGFVRTGVLEALQKEHHLDLSRLKIINKQNIPSFPLLASTRLYPEWPIAALPHINEELASHFTAALLLFHDHHDLVPGIQGFTIPMDYSPVEDILRALRAPPFEAAPNFTLKDILYRYQLQIIAGSASLILIISLGLYLLVLNRRIRQQRQQIAKEAEQHHTLLNALTEGVYGVDGQGLCTFINPAALELLNRSEDEVLGKNPTQLFHHYLIDYQCPVNQTLLDGQTRQSEEKFSRKNGDLFSVALNISPINIPGPHRGAVITFKDETLERFITDRNKMLVSALEAAQISVMITDTQAKIEWVNPAFENLTGFDSSEATGQSAIEIIKYAHDNSLIYKDLWATALRGNPWHGEITSQHKDGSLYDEDLTISPVFNSLGELQNFIAVQTNITERKQAERRIKHLAEHDSLTNLPNRTLLNDRLAKSLQTAKRNQTLFALIFLDLDKFKPVNDDYGHNAGDLLLKEVAVRINECLRESDTVARVGGDEFIILLPIIEATQDALMVAEKIRQSLNLPFNYQNHELSISSSIGIAVYPAHGQDEINLVKNADIAMYFAKNSGRNNVRIFEPSMLTE